MASLLFDCASDCNIARHDVLGINRDRHSVNGRAWTLLAPFFPNTLNMTCNCHNCDNCADKCTFRHLNKYIGYFNRIIANSPTARMYFKLAFLEAVQRYPLSACCTCVSHILSVLNEKQCAW
jgi:queuine/archaeosine tRNA-ribosyltransferase